MGLYITKQDVQIRLQGKVRFTDDFDDKNKMHFALLDRLIDEAEGQVEQDLSTRYFAPFQGINGEAFNTLPARPTRNIIRTLCELQAVMMVLDTDFGSGSAMSGDKYSKQLKDRYEDILDRVMRRRGEQKGEKGKGMAEQVGWHFPPLPGLKLNYFNTQADDGYAGMALSTSDNVGAYAQGQINDPGENFFTGLFEQEPTRRVIR